MNKIILQLIMLLAPGLVLAHPGHGPISETMHTHLFQADSVVLIAVLVIAIWLAIGNFIKH